MDTGGQIMVIDHGYRWLRGNGQTVYLDTTAPLLLQQDVLRLQVTVDDVVPVQGVQTLQDGVSKLPDQREAEALELVLLDQLIQVHAQQFKGHTDVVPEGEVLQHVDDVHGGVMVLLTEVLQDADLLRCLPVESLLVANHLQRYVGVALVVKHLDHLHRPDTGGYCSISTSTVR